MCLIFVFVRPSQLCLLLTKPGVSGVSHAPPATPNSPSSKYNCRFVSLKITVDPLWVWLYLNTSFPHTWLQPYVRPQVLHVLWCLCRPRVFVHATMLATSWRATGQTGGRGALLQCRQKEACKMCGQKVQKTVTSRSVNLHNENVMAYFPDIFKYRWKQTCRKMDVLQKLWFGFMYFY